MADVLVVDDESGICLAFEQLLRGSGHRFRAAGSAAAALDEVRRQAPDVIFLDVRLPDGDGLALLPRLLELAPAARIVVMTAFGSIETAVGAMQGAAFDYLPKPLDLAEIRRLLARALPPPSGSRVVSLEELGGENRPLVGRDHRIQEVFKLVGIVAGSTVNVLIEGESGVGKELVARAIHEHGPRRTAPFIAINCSAIPETLLESELFGHERGAYTGAGERRTGKFELAGEGTLFLDEVGDMTLLLQAKILRALQERRFERIGGSESIALSARIIAATHHDLENDIAAGKFREDLYYRLKVVSIPIPPLRARRGDIPLLVGFFLRQANDELETAIGEVDGEVVERLTTFDWPGNVRELENVVRRAAVLARGPRLQVAHLPGFLREKELVEKADAVTRVQETVRETLRSCLVVAARGEHDLFWRLIGGAERGALMGALEASDGNQVRASRLLGLNRGTLRRKMQEYGLFGGEDSDADGDTGPVDSKPTR